MNTLLLRVAAMVAALMLACTYATHAQFDTELIKSTEHADCGDSLSLYSLLSSPPVPITRAIDRFHLGLNWYGLDSLTRHIGISLIDNHVYTNGSSTDSTLPRYPDGTRLILVHNDYNLTEPNQTDCYVSTGHGVYNGEGYTLMTRVDPEIAVDTTTGLPVIESDTNTGAIHGFSTNTIGTVEQHWLQLRSSDSGTIAGNTNAHLWKTHNPDWLHFSVIGEGNS